MKPRICAVVLCVGLGALTAPAAWAQEEGGEGDPPKLQVVRQSYGGLTGFGDIITTEILAGRGLLEEVKLSARASFLFQNQSIEVNEKFGTGTARLEARAQLYTLQAAVGVLDLVEVSLSMPIVDSEQSSNVFETQQELGLGNPELSVKVRAPLEMLDTPVAEFLSLGAYMRLQLPWGEHNVFRPDRFPVEEGDFAEWELGTTVGVHAGVVSGYMNLAFRLIETGIQTFRYRFGVAVHPIEVVELGIYYDAEELEGAARSIGSFGSTLTVSLDPVFVMAGVEGLILDNGLDDATTTGAGDDVTGWNFSLAVGATF